MCLRVSYKKKNKEKNFSVSLKALSSEMDPAEIRLIR
jgi:hypothetical protein